MNNGYFKHSILKNWLFIVSEEPRMIFVAAQKIFEKIYIC